MHGYGKRPSKTDDLPVPSLPVFNGGGSLSPVFRNRRSGSALGTVPATVKFHEGIGKDEAVLPPPSLSGDDLGDLVGIMNQVYTTSEKQKSEATLRARQYEDRQEQLTKLMRQLAEANKQEMQERERTAFDATLEAERTQRERLGNKCHQLAAELVTTVKRNEELEMKLSLTESNLEKKDDEVSARQVETTRMEHEIIGLRAALERGNEQADEMVFGHPEVQALQNRVKQLETTLHATTTINHKSYAGLPKTPTLTPVSASLPLPVPVPVPAPAPPSLVRAKAIIVDAAPQQHGQPTHDALVARIAELEKQKDQEASVKIKLVVELQAAKDRLAEMVARAEKARKEHEVIPMYAPKSVRAPATPEPPYAHKRTAVAIEGGLEHHEAEALSFEECIGRADLMLQQIVEWKTRCVQVSRHLIVSAENEKRQKKLHAETIAALEAQCNNLQEEVTYLCQTKPEGSDNERYETKIQLLEEELKRQEVQGTVYEEVALDMEALRAGHEARESVLKQRIAELETENYDLECTKEIAETTCEEARQRIAALESSRDAWWQECSSILRQMADRRRETATTLHELDALRKEVGELRARNETLEAKSGVATDVSSDAGSNKRTHLESVLTELETERREKARLEDMLQNAFTESTVAVQALELKLQEARKTISNQRTPRRRDEEEQGPKRKRKQDQNQNLVDKNLSQTQEHDNAVPSKKGTKKTKATTPEPSSQPRGKAKYTKEGRKPGVPVFRKQDQPVEHPVARMTPSQRPEEAPQQVPPMKEQHSSRVVQTPVDVAVTHSSSEPQARQEPRERQAHDVFEIVTKKRTSARRSSPQSDAPRDRVSMAYSATSDARRDVTPLSEWQDSVMGRNTVSARSERSMRAGQKQSPQARTASEPHPQPLSRSRERSPRVERTSPQAPAQSQHRGSFEVVFGRSHSKSPRSKVHESWQGIVESEDLSPQGRESHFIGKDDMMWDDVLDSPSRKSSDDLAHMLDAHQTPANAIPDHVLNIDYPDGRQMSPGAFTKVSTPITAVNINLKLKNDSALTASTDSEVRAEAVEEEVGEMLENLKQREEVVRKREEQLLGLEVNMSHVGQERKELEKREAFLRSREQELVKEQKVMNSQVMVQQEKLSLQQKKLEQQQEVLQMQLNEIPSARSSPVPPQETVQSVVTSAPVEMPKAVQPLTDPADVLKSFMEHNGSDMSSRDLKRFIQGELERSSYANDEAHYASQSPGASTPDNSLAVHDLLLQLQQLSNEHRVPRRRRSRRRSPSYSSSSSSSNSSETDTDSDTATDSSTASSQTSHTAPVAERPKRSARYRKPTKKKPFKI
eukprot:TRINITY_DN4524_c0_g1_i2.p1 TRINITY_DN4524_c0_g1~~TRINITY_DN4524_c0_g1_i2.p1  ORF type:complete len:1322 (+),score=311.00 TRINITY_DN4524_c0_g1_i2:342-4307(+)